MNVPNLPRRSRADGGIITGKKQNNNPVNFRWQLKQIRSSELKTQGTENILLSPASSCGCKKGKKIFHNKFQTCKLKYYFKSYSLHLNSQIISHFSFVLSQTSLILTKFLENTLTATCSNKCTIKTFHGEF